MRKRTKSLLGRYVLTLTLIYTIVLTIGLLARVDGLPKTSISFGDKILHFLSFFILTALWGAVLLFKDTFEKFLKKIGIIVIGVIVYGILIEVLQDILTSYRSFDYLDMLANSVGALVAVLVALICKPYLEQFKEEI